MMVVITKMGMKGMMMETVGKMGGMVILMLAVLGVSLMAAEFAWQKNWHHGSPLRWMALSILMGLVCMGLVFVGSSLILKGG